VFLLLHALAFKTVGADKVIEAVGMCIMLIWHRVDVFNKDHVVDDMDVIGVGIIE